MMNAFAKLHPLTKAVFFTALFVLTLAASSPVITIISLCSVLLFTACDGGKAFFAALWFTLVVVAAAGLFNMLFVHRGEAVLLTVFGMELTRESLFYGLHQGAVMMSVLLWFRVTSDTLDSAETAYLLRFAPKLGLLFVLTLGFLPRFRVRLAAIRDAQKGLYPDGATTKKQKFKTALQNLSALISYSLEGSIITADSMRARGFRPGAVVPSRYRFSRRDALWLPLILGVFAAVLWALLTKNIPNDLSFKFYETPGGVLAVLLFAVLALLPLISEVWEVILWKRLSAKA